MAKYKSIPQPTFVEAMQYTGSNAEEIIKWVTSTVYTSVEHRNGGTKIVGLALKSTPYMKRPVNVGDYIVYCEGTVGDYDDGYYVWKKDEFEKVWTKTEDDINKELKDMVKSREKCE